MLIRMRQSYKPGIGTFVVVAGFAVLQLFKPFWLSPTIAAASSAQAAPPFRALFIGNSYTYFNGLPVVIRDLAAAAKEARPPRDLESRPAGH